MMMGFKGVKATMPPPPQTTAFQVWKRKSDKGCACQNLLAASGVAKDWTKGAKALEAAGYALPVGIQDKNEIFYAAAETAKGSTDAYNACNERLKDPKMLYCGAGNACATTPCCAADKNKIMKQIKNTKNKIKMTTDKGALAIHRKNLNKLKKVAATCAIPRPPKPPPPLPPESSSSSSSSPNGSLIGGGTGDGGF